MEDSRFESLFSDPHMQIDAESDQYKQVEPLMKKLEAKRKKLDNDIWHCKIKGDKTDLNFAPS